jgi:hypothetical protein
MRFVPKQCKVCPFRKTSAPGWLGAYTLGTLFSSIWKGFPFFCHSSMDYERPDWEEHALTNPRAGKHCVGGLVFAHKIMAPDREIKYPEVRDARERVLKIVDQVECMEPREFMAHHNLENLDLDAKKKAS